MNAIGHIGIVKAAVERELHKDFPPRFHMLVRLRGELPHDPNSKKLVGKVLFVRDIIDSPDDLGFYIVMKPVLDIVDSEPLLAERTVGYLSPGPEMEGSLFEQVRIEDIEENF